MSNKEQNNLDFESWDKKELLEYIKKELNNNNNNNVHIKNNNYSNAQNNNNNNKGKVKRELDFTKCCYRYIALKISYFGWSYQGFAAQAEDRNVDTIEGRLFDALKTLKLIKDRKSCHYSLCGRTDKGVSAFSQIVGLYVRSSLKNDKDKGIYTYEEIQNLKKKNLPSDTDSINNNLNGKIENNEWNEPWNEEVIKATENEMNYVNMLNRILPRDIRVLAWSPINPSFNARYDCLYRKYHYFFSGQDLDIKLMQEAAKKLEGHHDFRNFCKIDPTKSNKFQRTIYSCSIFKSSDISELCQQHEENEMIVDASPSSPSSPSSIMTTYHPFDIYVFEIKGMAFLWHQVRCCMAILFLIGKHKENPDIIDKLFDIDDKNDKGKPIYDLAPEIPLVLVDTGYPNNTFYWINDKLSSSSPSTKMNTKIENTHYGINYIKNLSVLLEIWQEEAIKLSLISKLILDQWNFQYQLKNLKTNESNTNINNTNTNNNTPNQGFIELLKFIQSYNLDGWYNSKRIQKIPVKGDSKKGNSLNYIPLLKRKKCNSFNEALQRKKQKNE
ncbi:pseudouridine synthase [Neocallimastix lanati (nom. inval.)]|jgi:tRNA pseudouridine38/39 synthase|nr:pseudouridine synthase [Neocallimastix sp. JGI-2020a]